MKKNMDRFQAELKTVTDKIADLVLKCSVIESRQDELSDAEYADYDKLSNELDALKERQNQILTHIHAP